MGDRNLVTVGKLDRIALKCTDHGVLAAFTATRAYDYLGFRMIRPLHMFSALIVVAWVTSACTAGQDRNSTSTGNTHGVDNTTTSSQTGGSSVGTNDMNGLTGTTSGGNIPVNPPATGTGGSPLANLATFSQGLWRGEDSRVSFHNGFYYTMFSRGPERVLFKSASIIDRGPGKVVPTANGVEFPLFAPLYIDNINGTSYKAWFAFDTNVWECDCADPYDNIDQWHIIKSMPLTGWSIDFEVFQNPQPGPYQHHWYMLWAGADSPSTSWGFESIFVAELLDLTPTGRTLSNFDNNDSARIIKYRFDWTDVIAEAPGMAIQGTNVSVVYSGNGAETSDYALGIGILKAGQNPSNPASWIDHNAGRCDGDVTTQPEFKRTTNVFGPGVFRQLKSADGSQDWMLYHSKIWDTYNRGAGTQGQQDNNQQWTRQINLKPLAWRQVTCGGTSYTIPSMGTPPDEGSSVTAPQGDAGLQTLTGTERIEAELMLPYGIVMGTSMQGIARINNNQDVITPTCACSSGAKITHLDALSSDQTATPKISGLVWNNAPPASHLTVAAAGSQATNLDLYINGQMVQMLNFPATANSNTFATTSFAVNIPRGAKIDLRYQAGKSVAPDLDYIELR